MANTVKLKITVDDDGSLNIVAKEAKKAATETENLGTKTEALNKKRNRYNRTEKGVAQITSNTTKGFAKQAQTISGGLVPAYAVLASNIFALTALFGFLKNASDVKILEQSQVSYATNTGIALQSVTSRLREASDGLLGFQQAGQAAAIGLAKGFSPKQLEDLAEGARKASTALGRDFQDSFDRLLRGASKAEPELLDELGITLRLADATEKYATAIGKNRDQLSDYERSQAVLIETQRQLEKNFGAVNAQTNPFLRLAKTLEDIVKTATQFVLPVFESFASLINKSGGFAVAAFGLLALNIAKAAIPVDGLKAKIEGIETQSKESLAGASKAIDDFKNKVKSADADIAASRAKNAKKSAEAILKSGGGQGSKLLEKVSKGQELSPQQRGQLKKMLRQAEAEYARTGTILKNTFKGVSISMVRDLSSAMDKVNAKSTGFFQRQGLLLKRLTLEINRASLALSRGMTKAWMGTARAATIAGKAFSKALSLAGFIGILLMIFELFKKIWRAPYTILASIGDAVDKVLSFFAPFIDQLNMGFLGFIDSAVNGTNNLILSIKTAINSSLTSILQGIDTIVNSITDKMNTFLSGLGTLLGKDFGTIDFQSNLAAIGTLLDETPAKVSKLKEEYIPFGDTITVTGSALRNLAASWGLDKHEMAQRAVEASNEAFEAFNETLGNTKSDLDAIRQGLKDTTLEERGIAGANALSSLGIAAQLASISAKTFVKNLHTGDETEEFIMNEDARKKALETLISTLSGVIDISSKFAKAMKENNQKVLQEMEILARRATTSLHALDEGLKTIRKDLSASLGGGDLLTSIQTLTKLKERSDEAADAFNRLGGAANQAAAAAALQKFREAVGEGQDAEQFLNDLIKLEAAERANALAKANSFRVGGLLGAQRNRLNEIQAISIKNAVLEKAKTQEKNEVIRAQYDAQIKLNEAKKEEIRLQQVGASQGQFMQASQTAAGVGDAVGTAFSEGDIKDKVTALNSYINPFVETMKKLGPEGEYVATAITGMGSFLENTLSTVDKMGSMETKTQKFAAGLSIAANAVTMLGQIQAAKSNAAIAGIDKEIAAEKKRDGKSAASVAKLKALEAKKEAMKRKAFNQNKKMMMAQAAMGTAAAIVNALQTVPFVPAGLAMAVIAGAMGAAQLAMISGMTYQGGGSSVSAAQPTSISMGQRRNSVDLAKSQSSRGELAYMRGERGMGGPENFRSAFSGYRNRAEGGNTGLIVGEQGPELFVPEVPGRVVPNDDIEAGSATNVSFNINTIDASGVEDMLLNQQGNIIGMIRQAANSYGQDFVEEVDTMTLAPNSTGAVSRY